MINSIIKKLFMGGAFPVVDYGTQTDVPEVVEMGTQTEKTI